MIKDIDSLRQIIRNLEKENKLLKQKLKENSISFNTDEIKEEKLEDNLNYDLDQGGRIIERYIDDDLARRFYGMFWGRTDVYAKRGRKGGEATREAVDKVMENLIAEVEKRDN